MHFAANSLVGESMRDPFAYLGDNVVNALNLLRTMDANGVKRIILSSTANLFAAPLTMPIDEDERISGCKIPAEIGPRGPGEPAILVAGSKRIRRELAWEPRYPDLESIIRTEWEWHSHHPNGYCARGSFLS